MMLQTNWKETCKYNLKTEENFRPMLGINYFTIDTYGKYT